MAAQEGKKKAQEGTHDRVLKKAQGSMEKGTTAGDALLEGNSPYWSRDSPDGTVACGGAHAGTGPLEGPMESRKKIMEKMEKKIMEKKNMEAERKSPCTNPNLLHYHCRAQGPEHNLRASEERGRKEFSPSVSLSSGLPCISPANW